MSNKSFLSSNPLDSTPKGRILSVERPEDKQRGSKFKDFYQEMNKVFGGKLIVSFLGVLLLVGAVVSGVLLTQQQQNVNERAATSGSCPGGSPPSGYTYHDSEVSDQYCCTAAAVSSGKCSSSNLNQLCKHYVDEYSCKDAYKCAVGDYCSIDNGHTDCSANVSCDATSTPPANTPILTSTPTSTPKLSITLTPTPTPKPTVTPTPGGCVQPLNVAITIDRSSTMNALESDGRKKLEWAKDAARTFVQTIQGNSSTQFNLSVNSFGAQGNFSQGASGGPGLLASPDYDSTLNIAQTNNYTNVINAINNIKYINPGTCIQCGIRIANQQITNTTTRKAEILISDGMANHTWTGTTSWINGVSNTQAAINEANTGRTLGIEYFVIGYGLSGSIDQTTLKAIAGNTSNYQYKPNVIDWTNSFLSIYNHLCGTTPTPLPKLPTPTSVSNTLVKIIPTADTYVDSGNSSTNYGSSSSLTVDGSPTDIIFMKFDLASITSTVTKAVLNLYVTNISAGTQNVKTVDTSWFENTLTYSNKPALGSLIKSFSSPTLSTYVQVDITSYVNSNKGKVVGIAIDSSASDGAIYASKASSTNGPYISIQY